MTFFHYQDTSESSTNKFIHFYMGNVPNVLQGTMKYYRLLLYDEGYYNLPRQRTVKTGGEISNYHDKNGIYYVISCYTGRCGNYAGRPFPNPLSCGQMQRYYVYKNTGTISLTNYYCENVFDYESEDDFDKFQVLATVSKPTNGIPFYLSSCHIHLTSLSSDNQNFNVYSYPNMFFKYSGNQQVNFVLRGTTERLNKVVFNLKINSYENSYLTFMEKQNEEKTISNYIIASSKQINENDENSDFFTTWTNEYESRLILIGIDTLYSKQNTHQLSDKTGFNCKINVFESGESTISKCYFCKEGYYLTNNECSNENQKCKGIENSNCLYCSEGYFIKNKECIEENKIISKCKKVVSNDRCGICEDNYHLENGRCIENTINDICISYRKSHCLRCKIGYSLEEGKCIEKEEKNCYYTNGKCKLCNYDYNYENGKCYKKIENCINQIQDKCIKCDSTNYYLIDGKCVLKDHDFCIETSSLVQCEVCENGITKKGSCSNEIPSCKYYENKFCLICESNFLLNNDNKTCEWKQ